MNFKFESNFTTAEEELKLDKNNNRLFKNNNKNLIRVIYFSQYGRIDYY